MARIGQTTAPAWEVLHSSPGRVRLGNEIVRENPGTAPLVDAALSLHPHVKKFRSTVLCASVLVYYDPHHTDPQALISYLESRLEHAPEDAGLDAHEPDDVAALATTLTLSLASKTLLPMFPPLSCYFILRSGRPIFRRADTAIRTGRINVDILDMLAILLCLAKKRNAAAALMISCVYLCNHLLERTRRRSRRLLTSAFCERSQFARVLSAGQSRLVPVDSLTVGEVILLGPSDHVPVDGEIVAGEATVDRHVLTGESVPMEVAPGDEVLARSVILTGSLQVRVEKTGTETATDKIVEIITRASRSKTAAQSLGEKLADSAVLPTIGLSLLALMRPRPDSALAIMNADYGTGIRAAAPIALLSYMACAARRGILIKDGSALESLAGVGTFVFDKTGTVTRDTPEVVEIASQRRSLSANDIVAYAAAAEQTFSHPIARAINQEARRLGLIVPDCSEPDYQVGWGVQVLVDGKSVKVGGRRFMKKEAVGIPPSTITELERFEDSGGTTILVAIDDRLAGHIKLRSGIRSEAFRIINQLKRSGYRVVLLSGDNARATKAIASRLGVDRYYAEVLPEEKGRYIESLQAEGERVAMIGDGINDSIALSSADVSMSMNGAADIANDVADVVFMDGGLSKFPLLLDISRQFTATVTRTFTVIAIANSLCILGALFDKASLRSAIVLNNLLNLGGAVSGLSPLYLGISENGKGCAKLSAGGSARSSERIR